jgi:hypothetical protein
VSEEFSLRRLGQILSAQLPYKEELKRQLEDAQRDWEVQQEMAIYKV